MSEVADHAPAPRRDHAQPQTTHDVLTLPALPGVALPVAPGTLGQLLADPRLSGRGNGVVRQAAVQRLQQTLGNRAAQRLIQRATRPASAPPPALVQRRPNRTGLPDEVKTGIEHLSGHALDDVRVHYNSPHPATVQALAYTQGTEIHVGPGQEQHVAHEAWHVVQQRRQPLASTMEVGGMGVNDDAGLEREADVMGAQAAQVGAGVPTGEPAPALGATPGAPGPVQRKVGLEFETGVPVRMKQKSQWVKVPYKTPVASGTGWHIEADSSNLEFVTDPFQTKSELGTALDEILADINESRDLMRGNDKEQYILNKKYRVGPGVNEFSSAPQATGGVPLDKVPEMLQRIATTRLPFLRRNEEFGGVKIPHKQRTLSGMFLDDGRVLAEAGTKAAALTAAIRKIFTDRSVTWPGHGFQKLEGLVGLIISYLIGGAEQTEAWEYSKIIAPLMSRVNFSVMHDHLEPDEKNFFSAKNILLVAKLGGSDRVFAQGYGIGEDVWLGPTREQWIESIEKKTVDLMSYGGGSNVAGGPGKNAPLSSGTSSSMGAMGAMDTSPEGVKLAVLELRRLPKNPEPELWKPLGFAIFDFFKSLDTSLRDAPEPPKAEGGPPVPVEAIAEVAASVPVGETPTPLPSPSGEGEQPSAPVSEPPVVVSGGSVPVIPLSAPAEVPSDLPSKPPELSASPPGDQGGPPSEGEKPPASPSDVTPEREPEKPVVTTLT